MEQSHDILDELYGVQQIRTESLEAKVALYKTFMNKHKLSYPAFCIVVEEMEKRYPPPPLYLVMEAAIQEVTEELNG